MSRHRLALTLLLAIFLGRIVLTYRVFNDTIDEPRHIVAGLQYLQYGTYSHEPQHPPLVRLALAAVPYYFAGFRLGHHQAQWESGLWERNRPGYYWLTLSLARAGNLIFALILFFCLYRWSSQLYGKWSGLAACGIAACCPNILAHASLATVDAGLAAMLLLAAYFLWRWSANPGWRYCLASGVACGLAVLAKFSALVFLPPLIAVYLALGKWKGCKLRAGALRAAMFLVAVGTVVWAGYRFDVGMLAPPGHRYVGYSSTDPASSAQKLSRMLEAKRLPATPFWQGIIDVAGHNETGHSAYLLGRISNHGWWYYFPIAVAVKTTIPLLLLVGLSLWSAAKTGRYREVAYPLAGIAIIMVVAMSSRLNIGIRHVLAIYPFFAILAAGLFRDHLRVLPLVLLGWHAAESVAAHPDYLPYFNEFARGREERILADSNLDWGQDLARLAQYTRDHGIDDLQLSYFGGADRTMFGFKARHVTFEPGWIAVSTNRLVGLTSDPGHRRLDWLRQQKPAARIGKSIWLYYLGESPK